MSTLSFAMTDDWPPNGHTVVDRFVFWKTLYRCIFNVCFITDPKK